MSTQYSVRATNNSPGSGHLMLFQKGLNMPPNTMSLAWFSNYTETMNATLFQWTMDYGFAWSRTGQLKPGLIFFAPQLWPADLTTTNQVTFTQDLSDYTYTFINQTTGQQPNTLFIQEDETIEYDYVSVGIGMSGSPTFAAQAMSNHMQAFPMEMTYWIAFGDFAPGKVLDVETITNAAQIQFPPGVYSMTAILNPDDTWTIEPMQQVD